MAEPCTPASTTSDGLASGLLDNGLAYYVWNHSDPKGYCELRLCVAVGSWYERDEESGFAHFVEHMAFKTTERFTETGSVIRFLESKGAQYGHDLNASTGLFDTTFRFQLPVRNGQGIEDGLAVLADWAFGIRATEADVESERPVILEEWRMKRGARERLKGKYWDRAVSARVAARFPIGDLAVIRKVSSTELREFYRQWYRPDRMAVVVAGDLEDCNSETVVARICKLFDRTACAPMCQPAALAPPTPQAGVLTCFLQDAEVTACSVALEILHALPLSADVAHLEREVARRVFTTILDRRFATLVRSSCPSCILNLAVSSRPLLPRLLCSSVTATVTTECGAVATAVSSALKLLASELTRIATHGVLKSEVKRAALSWKPAFSPDRPVNAAELAEDCLQHFRLGGEVPLLGPGSESTACRAFLESEDRVQEMVSELARQFQPGCQAGAWRICVQCGPGPALDLDSLWMTAMAEVAASPLPAWQDSASHGDDVISGREESVTALLSRDSADPLALSGDAAKSTSTGGSYLVHHMQEVDAVEFTLQNGLVALGLRRNTPGRVALQAFSLGGSTELEEEDECTMGVLDDVALAAGLGDSVDGAALAELQSAAQTRVNTQRHLYHRGLGGSTSTGRLELLLKLVAARFRLAGSQLQQCNSGAATAVCRARAHLSEEIRQRENSPHFELGQRARLLSCGGIDVPVLRPPSAEASAALSMERCAALQQRAFGVPANFTFVLVGDLPPDPDLGQLLGRYLGNLAQGPDAWLPPGRLTPQQLPADFAKGIVKEQLCAQSVEKATVLLIFHVAVRAEDAGQDHLDDVLTLQAACRCGSERLLAKLRGEEQGVYTVSMTLGRNSLSPHGHITIAFDCDPERQEPLTAAVLDELQQLQEIGPSSAEAAAVAAGLTDAHARNLKSSAANSYWLFFLLEAYKGERLRVAKAPAHQVMDPRRVEATAKAASHGYAARVGELVTAERLRSTFQRAVPLGNYVHLVLEPATTVNAACDAACDADCAPAKRPRL